MRRKALQAKQALRTMAGDEPMVCPNHPDDA